MNTILKYLLYFYSICVIVITLVLTIGFIATGNYIFSLIFCSMFILSFYSHNIAFHTDK